VEEMKKAGVKILRGDEWQVKRNLVLKERKVYVPKDKDLRVELVTINYWWPEVTKDVEKYVDGCDMCQKMKNWIDISRKIDGK